MNELILHTGEEREIVLVNPAELNLHIVQEAQSRLKLHLVCVPEQSVDLRYTIQVQQIGEQSRTELYGLAVMKEQNQLAIHTIVNHSVGGGYSKQLFKNILYDNAKVSFKGDLKIDPQAQKVEAYQTNRNILMSSTAEVKTEPQLEIYADDVKASHGATTGQLDANSLFYMQQRGISKQSAYVLLLKAFLNDVISEVSDKKEQQKLIDAIDCIIQ